MIRTPKSHATAHVKEAHVLTGGLANDMSIPFEARVELGAIQAKLTRAIDLLETRKGGDAK